MYNFAEYAIFAILMSSVIILKDKTDFEKTLIENG